MACSLELKVEPPAIRNWPIEDVELPRVISLKASPPPVKCFRYEFTPPVRQLGAHTTPLGLKFYTGQMFPPDYRGQIFVAEHGSWNRDDPIGYRIMLARRERDQIVDYRPFATGWLHDGEVWGRPVDIVLLPSGAMLVSDDKGNRIFRIRYRG